ncbi:ABC transporter permease [Rhizobium sp. CNPSo 3464]|uniref:ABC transporter permease n=1 Tax=Rhizobium sp. CNPSo 3464 TaxID=3021406 RepID=UPI0025513BB5|nr:ABC transporter permease [Rhizobium sp. CNPSo 3464]MDK4741314.1 ABC transporter permease [Rhizobium sp. CNPSo 3464]
MIYQNSIKPWSMFSALTRHRELLWELIKRDFVGRYKGSFMGVAWSLFNPLLMLVIYTFVFSVAFKARWGVENEGKVNFAIVLFSGLIIHTLFAECLNRSPMLISSHPNYVKKVVFPVEILPWMALGSALGHFLVSLSVLIVFCVLSATPLHLSGLMLPIILLPLLLMVVGLGWLLSSLGVFLRDLAQVIAVITTITLFLAPVFYPIDALPPSYQSILIWNPVTLPILQFRGALLWGEPLQWVPWGVSLIIGIAVCYLGFAWFQKTRRGFADVL